MINPFSLPPLPVAKGVLGKVQMALTIKAMIEDKKKSAEAIKNAAVALALQKALEIKDKKVQELREKGEVVVANKKKELQAKRPPNIPNVPTSARNIPNMRDIDNNPRIKQLERERAEINLKQNQLASELRQLREIRPDDPQISTKLVEFRALTSKSASLVREIGAERRRLIDEAFGRS